MQKITPCLWFDTEGEEAARFYTSVFPNSRIIDIAHYGEAGPRPEGMVMAVSFELDGQKFVALNGGPEFTFDEAISFQVPCENQEEVDAFWSTLSADGEEGPPLRLAEGQVRRVVASLSDCPDRAPRGS